ncbi:MAG: gliding motility-associated C-terminal domain-containing protein [Ignavibacterium sp.]|nr:gliding motility-associated C-terminal domain-containing protein [Ignavibacterium sp.]
MTDFLVDVEERPVKNTSLVSITNYPNPFNSTTNFIITIPNEFQSKPKEINIYNGTGEKIFSINASEKLNAIWDGKDMMGNPVSTGIYYYQLVIGGKVHKNGKTILLK